MCYCKKHLCKTNMWCDPHCKCRLNNTKFHPKCKCIPKSLMRLAAEKVFKPNIDLSDLPITLQIYVYGTLCYCSMPPRFVHVECLRYSLFQGDGLRLFTLKSLACLRYAVEECGLILKTSFYEQMCYDNNFDMFKFTHEKGVPWSEKVCDVAARLGRYNFLVYAHQNGCPWNWQVQQEAYFCGHADCLTYVHDHMQDCSSYVKNVKFFLRQAKLKGKLITALILLGRVVWKEYITSWF